MNWAAIAIPVVVIFALIVFRRAGQVSAKTARAYLQQGAVVVDVRSNAEFQSGHLRDALHIPLNELEPLIARRVNDKTRVLLIHCQSGLRSKTARRKLIRLGYTRAFNLGSYARASRIVERH